MNDSAGAGEPYLGGDVRGPDGAGELPELAELAGVNVVLLDLDEFDVGGEHRGEVEQPM